MQLTCLQDLKCAKLPEGLLAFTKLYWKRSSAIEKKRYSTSVRVRLKAGMSKTSCMKVENGCKETRNEVHEASDAGGFHVVTFRVEM